MNFLGLNFSAMRTWSVLQFLAILIVWESLLEPLLQACLGVAKPALDRARNRVWLHKIPAAKTS